MRTLPRRSVGSPGDSLGSHPEVERAVALVNLPVRSADSVATTLESFGETDVVLTEGDVAGLRTVCDALRAVFAETDRDQTADRLNALLAAHAGAPRLVCHEGWDWHLHVDRADDAPWADWLAASAALALASRLAASAVLPWGVCAADGCVNVYVHDGRGGERRWCSTTCATRERVRRHRVNVRTRPARRASAGASATA